jgi:hypothetical protein
MNDQRMMIAIEEVTAEFNIYFFGLTNQQLNDKENDLQWSIAQHIEHIMLVNKSYLHEIDALRLPAYKLPLACKLKYLIRYFGKREMKRVGLLSNKKLETINRWMPLVRFNSIDMIEEFLLHQQNLQKIIKDSGDLLLAGVMIRSPVNRIVVYKVEDVFKIMIAHEQRHFKQVKKIRANQIISWLSK